MRIITQKIASAFLNKYSRKISNTYTDGNAIFLHDNKIAEWRDGALWITNAGWSTVTTKERLNGLPNVRITQRNYEWFLNKIPWNGEWIQVSHA